MKEAKIDFDLLKVGNSLSNRGLAEIFFSPLALIGNEIMNPPTQKKLLRVKEFS